jgi:hypothetical protein
MKEIRIDWLFLGCRKEPGAGMVLKTSGQPVAKALKRGSMRLPAR